MHTKTLKYGIAVLGTALLVSISQAGVTGSQRIEPTDIDVGEAARLTISESGDSTGAMTPPMVPGLEFVPTNQSQRTESINGVSHTTTSVTYEVIAQKAGMFTIPSAVPGAPAVTLRVNAGATNHASQGSQPAGGISLSRPSVLPAGTSRLTADGSAFVRLRLAKHELYVGETVPVDIQVGMRDGFVASLNGLPTLNGDAFTLNKLSSEATQTQENIGGKAFTVLTWHSALTAVKPGTLSLTMETPLTVRMRSAQRPGTDQFEDQGLNDFFNDPAFQSFFGTTTEKDVTVASSPTTFSVLELPAQHRPANFSGAVGHFGVSASLSDDKAAVGDPITLRMRVSGEGNFDRVNSPTLQQSPDWKAYAPTAAFKAADSIGYRGEKTFEQPLIATRAALISVPEISFSWFDPTTKRYELSHTAPLSASITPASGGSNLAQTSAGSPSTPAPVLPVLVAPSDGLRADHLDNGRGARTLMPHYYQASYIAAPSLLLIALSGSMIFLRRRERDRIQANNRDSSQTAAPYLRLMEEASAARDSALFFKSARTALQLSLAARWHYPLNTITEQTIDARLGIGNGVSRIFRLADETAFSGIQSGTPNFTQWKPLIQSYLSGEELS